ncbi:MAG: hypothetical protein AB1478_10560 [Nitrospirota bacterium]
MKGAIIKIYFTETDVKRPGNDRYIDIKNQPDQKDEDMPLGVEKRKQIEQIFKKFLVNPAPRVYPPEYRSGVYNR